MSPRLRGFLVVCGNFWFVAPAISLFVIFLSCLRLHRSRSPRFGSQRLQLRKSGRFNPRSQKADIISCVPTIPLLGSHAIVKNDEELMVEARTTRNANRCAEFESAQSRCYVSHSRSLISEYLVSSTLQRNIHDYSEMRSVGSVPRLTVTL